MSCSCHHEREHHHEHDLCGCCHHEHNKHEENESFLKSEKGERLITICRIVIAVSLGLLAIYLPSLQQESLYPLKLTLAIIGYLIISYDVIFRAFKSIFSGEFFDENFLMLVGTLGAMIILEFAEAVFVMAFYHLGEMLEDYAEDKSKESITKLVNDMPLYAHKVDDKNNIIELTPSQINIGDVIKVLPGEKISLDGVVIKGSTSLNMASLTGESLPKEVKVDDQVFSGSINNDGVIYIKVTKLFKDSTLSTILDLINAEEEKKSKSERFITKFAKIYTPIVVLSAIILFIVKYGLAGWGSNYSKPLYDACTLLIISCPCALVVSIPLGFFVGIGRASRFGVLLKGSSSIENLSKADTFVFDKTGTLTKGEFEVVSYTSENVLKIAASLESNSTHPIGKSIVKKVETLASNSLFIVTDFKNESGKGIKGKINDKTYYLGDRNYVSTLVKDFKYIDSPYKVIYVVEDDKCIGNIIICDVIKQSSYKLVEDMSKFNNTKLVMLSGDNQNIVDKVKEELKFDQAYGNLMPQDKLDKINQLKQESSSLVFVGDGVNDAPSLLASDCGIAMGGLGSDVAKQSADVIILNDDMHKISQGKKLARKTMKIVIEDIIIILAIKLAIFVIASIGIPQIAPYQMYLAVVADVGTLVIGVLNCLRIYYLKDKALE